MERLLHMAQRAEHVATQLYNTPIMLDGQTAEEQGIDLDSLTPYDRHSYDVVQQLTANVWDTMQRDLQTEENHRGVFTSPEDRRNVVRLIWSNRLADPIGPSEGEGYQHSFDDLHEERNAVLNIGEKHRGFI